MKYYLKHKYPTKLIVTKASPVSCESWQYLRPTYSVLLFLWKMPELYISHKLIVILASFRLVFVVQSYQLRIEGMYISAE